MAAMVRLPKKVKGQLRELAGLAYEREMGDALMQNATCIFALCLI